MVKSAGYNTEWAARNRFELTMSGCASALLLMPLCYEVSAPYVNAAEMCVIWITLALLLAFEGAGAALDLVVENVP